MKKHTDSLIIGIDIRAMTANTAGIGNYVSKLYAELCNAANSVTLIAYSDKSSQTISTSKTIRSRIIKMPSFIWHIAAYFDALFITRVDVYFSTHSSLICLFPFLKTVVTIQDLSSITQAKTHTLKERIFLSSLLLRLALHNTHRIIVPSQFTKNEIIKYFSLSQDKIVVVPLGVVTLPRSNKESSIAKKPYFIFIGTIEPRKNLTRLINAFTELKKEKKIPHKLIIAGKRGWYSDPIYDEAKKSAYPDDIIFTGFLPNEELASLLGNAEALVLPSLYEGFGLPVLQAADLRVPVITSNVSSLPELLGEYAIYVDPLSVASIKEGMDKVLRLNQKQKNDIIEKAYKKAQEYSWEKAAAETLTVLKSAI